MIDDSESFHTIRRKKQKSIPLLFLCRDNKNYRLAELENNRSSKQQPRGLWIAFINDGHASCCTWLQNTLFCSLACLGRPGTPGAVREAPIAYTPRTSFPYPVDLTSF